MRIRHDLGLSRRCYGPANPPPELYVQTSERPLIRADHQPTLPNQIKANPVVVGQISFQQAVDRDHSDRVIGFVSKGQTDRFVRSSVGMFFLFSGETDGWIDEVRHFGGGTHVE